MCNFTRKYESKFVVILKTFPQRISHHYIYTSTPGGFQLKITAFQMVHTRLKEPYREEKKKLHPGNHAGNLGFRKKLYWRQWLSCGILLDSTQDLMFWVFALLDSSEIELKFYQHTSISWFVSMQKCGRLMSLPQLVNFCHAPWSQQWVFVLEKSKTNVTFHLAALQSVNRNWYRRMKHLQLSWVDTLRVKLLSH